MKNEMFRVVKSGHGIFGLFKLNDVKNAYVFAGYYRAKSKSGAIKRYWEVASCECDEE